ncbi:MAG: hypothetical protein AUK51_04375 [Comamonadaceae bacterium CG2_30_59_20]|nr:MAG: hypothetical protein AUK51_04375 [Comamonadaceae bacterium CG2_30_59_20]
MRPFFQNAILVGALAPALAGAFTPISLSAGWNLVGNSDPVAIDVATKLSGAQITTVWKWNKSASRWAFYTPAMSAAELATYAASKQYDVLSTIDSKEGFWVNATAAVVISDPLAPPPAVGTGVTLTASDLAPNWNLMASADKKTPSELNAGLVSSLTAASKSISTLWAWDAASSSWRFYAPSLESNGQLASYIASKNYLPFISVLAATDGFWVNIGAATPVVNPPSAVLRRLRFTNANDWFFRINSSTSAEATPASDGSTLWRQTRTARVPGGASYSWTTGSRPLYGADVHWNGAGWVNCPVNFQNIISALDANGNASYSMCNGWETGVIPYSMDNLVDISARAMIDVYNEIQSAGYTDLIIDSATSVLGAVSFPSGSTVSYRNLSTYVPTVGYSPGASNWVYLSDAQVGAGDSTACNANPFPAESPNATLEQLIAVNQGKPCVYGVNTVTGANGVTLSSGARNEGWSGTTLSMGTIGSAPTYADFSNATSYYTTNQKLRVAFGAGNVAKYYSCQQRWTGSNRNCDLIGTGTYSIQTLGDARTLSFTGVPSQFAARSYTRVFVERGGRVYYGYLDNVIPSKQARLNLLALNSLFNTLGLPAFNPDAKVVLSIGSYEGTYSSTFTGTDTGTVTTTVSPSGATTCSGTSTQAGAFACSFSLTPTGVDGTTANISLGITGTGAAFNGTANYYTGVVSGTWSNTGGAGGSFTGMRH